MRTAPLCLALALLAACATPAEGGRVVKNQELSPFGVWHRYADVLVERARQDAAEQGDPEASFCAPAGGVLYVLAFGTGVEDVEPTDFVFDVDREGKAMFHGFGRVVDGPGRCGVPCGLWSGHFLRGGKQACYCTLFSLPLEETAARYDLRIHDVGRGEKASFTVRNAGASGRSPVTPCPTPSPSAPPAVACEAAGATPCRAAAGGGRG